MTDFYLFDTPLGPMALASEDGRAISRLYLPNAPLPRLMPHATPLMEEGARQLLEYLNGQRQDFDLPLAPQGTPFQQKVWAALRAIPYGQTRTYKDIALAADCPKGYRAVGMANHRNPIPIFIPCHRVVGSDRSLTGYAGGVELKQALLALERKKNFLPPLANSPKSGV